MTFLRAMCFGTDIFVGTLKMISIFAIFQVFVKKFCHVASGAQEPPLWFDNGLLHSFWKHCRCF